MGYQREVCSLRFPFVAYLSIGEGDTSLPLKCDPMEETQALFASSPIQTKEEKMVEERRGFLKKLATAGAAASAGAMAANASPQKQRQSSNGVVVGKSPKKEILYQKTEAWEAYYSAAK